MKRKSKPPPGEGDPRVAYFDDQAVSWDDDADKVARTLARLSEMKEPLALRAGEDLLEVGCGTGQITPWLCSAVSPGRVVAVDFAPSMLAKARAKDIPAEFRLLDVCSEILPARSFDVVLCFHSFPHFRDQRSALRNLAAALKPAGRLLVVHLAGSEQINAMHTGFGGAVGGDHLPARDVWPELLASAGLSLEEIVDRPDLFFLRAVGQAS